MSKSRYEQAGVNIDAGTNTVNLLKKLMQKTYNHNVLSQLGSFGGMLDVSYLKSMKSPVLVASTDGVGTKTKIATALERFDTLGQDLVNHCINDILVQGAAPLFFLDYIATSKLNPEIISKVVGGIILACNKHKVALLGGETAEMPGVYLPSEIDLAGTIVGVVERDNIVDGSKICEGDIVLGLTSTGLHTNGYSLARNIIKGKNINKQLPELGESLGDALLKIHRCYLPEINLLRFSNVTINGLIHITGGGLIDNPPRVIPQHLSLSLYENSWEVPPLFSYLQQEGKISREEMFKVFNMGLGMLIVLPPDAHFVLQLLKDYQVSKVGEIIKREGASVII